MKTEFEKCMAGEPFMILRTRRLLAQLNSTDYADNERKQAYIYSHSLNGCAGSVVTHSIPANCVAVGNPCRVIRNLQAGQINVTSCNIPME